MNKQEQFYEACENGDLKLFNKLIKDPEVDPSASGNYSIRWASRSGHWEIVKLILDDYKFKVDEYFTDYMKIDKKLRDLVPQIIKDLYL